MFSKLERFPETAVFTNNCFDERYIFRNQAIKVFEAIQNSIDSSLDKNQAYFNNTIGILGGRGSGKTSLLKSVMKTIETKENLLFRDDEKETYFVMPLTASDLIDPKVLPNNISIVNYVLSVLYIAFKKMIVEKKIKDTEANPIFVKFDELNESISLLTRVIRQDPIDNPSDLYDIGNILNIRSDLEDLVKQLLDFYTKDQRRAFLVFIDDFDLDSTNIHNMVLDLSSFLSIKGLIFLTSFDPEVFSNEIIRQRIKIISDYGVNHFIRADSSRYVTAQHPFFDPADIIDSAKKYEEQIYNKFIPHDFRILLSQTSNYAVADSKLENLLSQLTKHLFGFSREDKRVKTLNAYRERVLDYIIDYCDRFNRAIASTSDLRTRNQLLNQIIDSLDENNGWVRATAELKKNLEGMSRIVESKEDKTLLGSVANQLIKQSSSETNDALVRNQIIYEDGDFYASAKSLAPEYWNSHPCAPILYNEIISRIDLEENDYPHMIVALFELFRRESLKTTIIGDDEVVEINGRTYNIELFAHPSMSLNGKAIAKSIQLYVSNSRAIAKYQIEKYASLLEEYNTSLSEEDRLLTRYIVEIKNLTSTPWKGADIRTLRTEARRCLLNCARRLQK